MPSLPEQTDQALLDIEGHLDRWVQTLDTHINKLISASNPEALKPNEVELALARTFMVQHRLLLTKLKMHSKGSTLPLNSALLDALMGGEESV